MLKDNSCGPLKKPTDPLSMVLVLCFSHMLNFQLDLYSCHVRLCDSMYVCVLADIVLIARRTIESTRISLTLFNCRNCVPRRKKERERDDVIL